jgi:hypothetical protein
VQLAKALGLYSATVSQGPVLAPRHGIMAPLTLPVCLGLFGGSKDTRESPVCAPFERTPSAFRRTPSGIKDARDRSHGVDIALPQPASESKRLGGAGAVLP